MSSFPSYQSILSFNEQPQQAVRRTPFESGYQQQSKRYYNLFMSANVQVLMTDTQYEAFLTWYRDDIANGSGSFSFVNHKNNGSPQGTITARIIDGAFQSNPIRNYHLGLWIVDFTLEYKNG